MKRKGGQLLIGVLAALAFILVIYYANHDRPVYKEGDTSGQSAKRSVAQIPLLTDQKEHTVRIIMGERKAQL